MSDRVVFRFEIGGYFQGHNTLTIRNTPTGPTCEFECWPKQEGPGRRTTLPVTDEQIREIDALAMRCGVSGWNESYGAPRARRRAMAPAMAWEGMLRIERLPAGVRHVRRRHCAGSRTAKAVAAGGSKARPIGSEPLLDPLPRRTGSPAYQASDTTFADQPCTIENVFRGPKSKADVTGSLPGL